MSGVKLTIWQGFATLLGWQYAAVRLNPGRPTEHWVVARVHTRQTGTPVIRLYASIRRFGPAYDDGVWVCEPLSNFEYRPLTSGLQEAPHDH